MNFTTSSNQIETFKFDLTVWQTNLIVSILLSLLSLYIFVALMYHQCKTKKQNSKPFGELPIEKKYAFVSKIFCILVGVMCLLRNAITIGNLWFDITIMALPKNESILPKHYYLEVSCQILPRARGIFLGVGFVLAYLYLWLGQRIFYVHHVLKASNNKLTTFVSGAIFVISSLCLITIVTSYFAIVRFHVQPGYRCTFDENIIFSYGIIMFTTGILSIATQVALLLLFVYPLKKKTEFGLSEKKKKKQVIKASCLAATCLVTDIMSASLSIGLYLNYGISLSSYYSINLSINHIATIACVDYWKKLIWPWNIKKNTSIRNKKSNDKLVGSAEEVNETNETAVTNA